MSASVPRRLWAWSALGLAGSSLVALVAPRALGDGIVGWWYHPGFPDSRQLAVWLVWIGMAALAIAWLGVALGRRGPTVGQAVLVGGAWMLPLALAPPLFSRDVYSYLAQGTILHLGLSPYHQAPAILAGLGREHTLAAVSPFWRHTTAPYGPLFLELISLIIALTGQHLIGGVLLCRLLDLIGLGLIVGCVPRLTRALGADAGRGVWLAAASPLVALGLISACHNDVLMVGLLAAGVELALRGKPLHGIALCALASTIKIPALVGAVFIAVCWARAERGRAGRLGLLTGAAAIVVVVLGAVTLASGVGVGWISSSVFSTPAKVRLAITPSTGVGYTIASLLHDAGVAVSSRGLESALGVAGTAVAACLGLALLWRARVPRMTALLGATLILAAAGGPAAWPWYLTWGLVLLAVCPGPQRQPAFLAPLVIGAFLVKPNGVLVLPLPTAPAVLVVELALAGGGWAWWRRSRARAAHPVERAPRAGSGSGSGDPPAGLPSALART